MFRLLLIILTLTCSISVRAQQDASIQQKGESLRLDWPDNEHWKVGSNRETEEMRMVELIPEKETMEDWTEMGMMMSIKGATGVPVDMAMNMLYNQSQKFSSKAKLTFIEKDEQATHPWILFTIEASGFDDGRGPESQLWYIVQGETALYTNFRAVKKSTISKAQKEKWTRFFKTAKVVTL